MTDYLLSSLVWSLGGLIAGVVLGYELRFQIDRLFIQEEVIMTTPERLKRRQVLEGTALVILGILTLAISLYFRHADGQQRDCLDDFISTSSQTTQIRAKLIAEESAVTRKIITAGLSARSYKDLKVARRAYLHDLKAIDEARASNPVPVFKGCP